MNYQRCLICLLTILIGVPAVAGQSGENIALGKTYTLTPPPNYALCTDPGDSIQLTDGKVTNELFWTQRGSVGWSSVPYAAITVDLGRVEPICGVSFRTAGGGADVGWPAVVRVLIGEDGRSFRDFGDLVTLDHKDHGPWPDGYAIRRLSTSKLGTRGRFVRFVALSLNNNFNYVFCDEIEVFRGAPELIKAELSGTSVSGDVEQFFGRWLVPAGIRNRFELDIKAVGKAIDAATLPAPSLRKTLLAQWTNIGTTLRASSVPCDTTSFRTILPYNEAHAQLFRVQAALWKAQGRPSLTYAIPAIWDPTDLTALPATGGQIEVHTMLGEYRAAAVNLANASDAPIEVRIHFDNLPDSPTPRYVTVHEVPWTDTAEGQPVASALPLATRDGPAWRVTVLPGVVRQVWFTFHTEQTPPGDYKGKLVVENPHNGPLQVPIHLRVYPLDFPQQTTLQLGGWDYTDAKGHGGMMQQKEQYIELLKTYFVNAPWATSSVMLPCSFAADGTAKLNTQMMDEWLTHWPNARRYSVYLNVPGQRDFGGAKLGSPEFDRHVGAWISAWVRHLGVKGIPPERLALLLHDEPGAQSDIGPFLAWAKAIHAEEPRVIVYETAFYDDPAKAPAAFFEACNVLCPHRPMWLDHNKSFTQFYRDQQRKGRTLNLYSSFGPARLLDPYSYYRLQAWHCWQIGATGSFFWAFGDNRESSSWNEYPVRIGPFTPLFLDDTTVTPAKQMEAIREGVEDYEYLLLLRNAVDKAKVAGRSDLMLNRAESLLATAADEILTAHSAGERDWRTPKDRTKADAVRIQILETLSALQSTKL